LTQPVEPLSGTGWLTAAVGSFGAVPLAVAGGVLFGGRRLAGAAAALVSPKGGSRFACSVFGPLNGASLSGGELDNR